MYHKQKVYFFSQSINKIFKNDKIFGNIVLFFMYLDTFNAQANKSFCNTSLMIMAENNLMDTLHLQ